MTSVFTPDDKTLAVGNRNDITHLHDVASGRMSHALAKKSSHELSLSPDGWTLAVGYMSADLTGVRMQGANGAAAEGRVAAVGMVFNADVPGPARYVSELSAGQAGVGDPLRRQAPRWCWTGPSVRWPSRTAGPGWRACCGPTSRGWSGHPAHLCHVAEHLNAWAKAMHASDAGDADRVAGEWCHRLQHEGGAAVPARLWAVDVCGRSAGGAGGAP